MMKRYRTMTKDELMKPDKLIQLINDFQIDKAHGCTPTIDEYDCIEDAYPSELIAIINSGDRNSPDYLYEILYRAFKLGHMKARGIIQ